MKRAVALAGQDPHGGLQVELFGAGEAGAPPSLLLHVCGDSLRLGRGAYSLAGRAQSHVYTWSTADLDWSGLRG